MIPRGSVKGTRRRQIVMAAAAYRGKLPKPDPNGVWRPYVGKYRNGKAARFTVGNRRDVSEGEAQRRLDAVRDLYDKQCKAVGLPYWHNDVLETAQQIAAGQSPTIQYANGDGSPGEALLKAVSKHFGMPELVKDFEDNQLARLVAAAGASPADPVHYRQVIAALSESVRKYVQSTVDEITERAIERFGPAVVGKLPPNPLDAETRTFHDALKAYRDHIDKTGDRDERHKLRPHPRRCQDRARWLEAAHADFPLFELDLARLDELVSYWRNRPETGLGKRCSIDHSSHMTDELFRVLRWLDNQPDWKWEMPRGARALSASQLPWSKTSSLNEYGELRPPPIHRNNWL